MKRLILLLFLFTAVSLPAEKLGRIKSDKTNVYANEAVDGTFHSVGLLKKGDTVKIVGKLTSEKLLVETGEGLSGHIFRDRVRVFRHDDSFICRITKGKVFGAKFDMFLVYILAGLSVLFWLFFWPLRNSEFIFGQVFRYWTLFYLYGFTIVGWLLVYLIARDYTQYGLFYFVDTKGSIPFIYYIYAIVNIFLFFLVMFTLKMGVEFTDAWLGEDAFDIMRSFMFWSSVILPVLIFVVYFFTYERFVFNGPADMLAWQFKAMIWRYGFPGFWVSWLIVIYAVIWLAGAYLYWFSPRIREYKARKEAFVKPFIFLLVFVSTLYTLTVLVHFFWLMLIYSIILIGMYSSSRQSNKYVFTHTLYSNGTYIGDGYTSKITLQENDGIVPSTPEKVVMFKEENHSLPITSYVRNFERYSLV